MPQGHHGLRQWYNNLEALQVITAFMIKLVLTLMLLHKPPSPPLTLQIDTVRLQIHSEMPYHNTHLTEGAFNEGVT